jgi:hypothetical protein
LPFPAQKRFEELEAAHHCTVEEMQLQKEQFQAERELAAARWTEESGKWEARQAALIAEKEALTQEVGQVDHCCNSQLDMVITLDMPCPCQVDTLKLEAEEHAEEIAGFQKQLEDLRSRVASIVTSLLESKISKLECTKAIRCAACTVTYLRGSNKSTATVHLFQC